MELTIRADAKADALPLALVMQSLNVLSMDACTLEERIQKALLENPMLESAPSHLDNETRDYLFSQVRQTVTFQEELHRQLGCLNISDRLAYAADLLIDCLDDDGYLREDLSQLAEEWHMKLAFLEEALRIVQSLEPAGVGCRDLSECLRLQLLDMESPNPLALDIVSNHLNALATRSLSLSDYDPEELEDAIAVIQSLSPHPCANCGEDHTQYIIPDIRVFLDDEQSLRAELINQPAVPVLSPLYHDYLKASTGEDRQYIRNQMDAARSFLHAIQMRVQTLSLISQFLITHQREYFLSGPETQRSISLSTLAEALEVNVSTVSRAVAGKYVEFSGKVFPLRDFFHGNGSNTYSRTAIIHRIQTILDENPALSDSKIAARLEQDGIHISRRTVNKYRNLGK